MSLSIEVPHLACVASIHRKFAGRSPHASPPILDPISNIHTSRARSPGSGRGWEARAGYGEQAQGWSGHYRRHEGSCRATNLVFNTALPIGGGSLAGPCLELVLSGTKPRRISHTNSISMLHHNTSYLVLLALEVDVTPRMAIARQLMQDPICQLSEFGLLIERRLREVRRKTLPRGWVNRAMLVDCLLRLVLMRVTRTHR